jgi:hypothetical protein
MSRVHHRQLAASQSLVTCHWPGNFHGRHHSLAKVEPNLASQTPLHLVVTPSDQLRFAGY